MQRTIWNPGKYKCPANIYSFSAQSDPSFSFPQGVNFYVPFIVDDIFSLSAISFSVFTASASTLTVRSALYSPDLVSEYPSQLLVDSGDHVIAAGTSGTVDIPITYNGLPGIYYAAIKMTAASDFKITRGVNVVPGIISGASAQSAVGGLSASESYGAFANIAPTQMYENTVPLLFLKKA